MKGDDWTQHTGKGRPRTGERPILVRLRCVDRSHAESQQPRPASWWKNWRHNDSPGDIVEWRFA